MKLHNLAIKAEENSIDDETMILCDGFVERRAPASNDNSRTVDFVFSSANKDRCGDIVEQLWNLAHFKRNPIILFNHNPNLPIAKCIKIGMIGGKLCGTVEFPAKGLNALSDQIYDLIQAGILNAGSVGFVSTEREVMRDKEGHYTGMTFKKPQLLEFSVVSIPANADALITARSMGIDVSAVSKGLGDLRTISMVGAEAAKLAIDALSMMPVTRAARLVSSGKTTSAYDNEGIFMGFIKDGRLSVTKSYQASLAERNIAAIEQQGEAAAATGADEAEQNIIGEAGPEAIAPVSLAARQHQEQRLKGFSRYLH